MDETKVRDPDAPPRLVHVVTVAMTLGFLRDSIRLLQRQGVDVHAACSPDPEASRLARELRIHLHTLPMSRRITPARDGVAVLRMAALFRRIRPSIVHGHTPKGGLVAMLAATLARVPVRVYHLRGLRLEGDGGLKRALLTWTERVSCGLAHRVIAVGPSVRVAAVEHRLASADKIVVLASGSGQGVDAAGRFDPGQVDGSAVRSRLGIGPEAPVLGFVGRLVVDKGVVELHRVWLRLREDHPDLRLLLVGPWETEDAVPLEVRAALELDERVHCAGAVPDPAPWYAAMDVLALPSRREGFPNVPLEAAAMKVPVVAAAIPGCRDAVEDGATGTLVPPGDADALAAAIERYLADPELRSAHGRAGRERALRLFEPQRISLELYSEYRALLAREGLELPLLPGNRGD